MAHQDDSHPILPFLNVFKDGHLVDTFCLDSGDFFVLGRHTNCDVLLAHPSISRHHLEIQLLHSTREIVLTDMDSVHGTWIDGKQIPALIPYTVNEGVAIKLAASSRTYKVQWLHHPTSAPRNERSIMPGAVDLNLSNVETMVSVLACSTTSNERSLESSQAVDASQPARTNNACSTNRKTGSDVPLEDSSSLCWKHNPLQEVVLPGSSASGFEALNANTLLQTSQQLQQKEGLPPLPRVSRRTPFAPLPQNAASPTFKKKPKTAEKKLKEGEIDVACTDKLTEEGEENVLAGSRLWLRRSKSAPSPILEMSAPFLQVPDSCIKPSSKRRMNTNRLEKAASSIKNTSVTKSVQKVTEERETSQSSNVIHSNQLTLEEKNVSKMLGVVNLQNEGTSGGSHEQGGAQVLTWGSLGEAAVQDEYPSDKENQEPVLYIGSKHSREGRTSSTVDINRKPFQPLVVMPHGAVRLPSPCGSYISNQDDDSFLARVRSRPSSVVQNLDYMLQKLRGMARSQPHHAWHIVVDRTCLLDPKSFKSLKLLEGIKEVRIIIPQIVIRELDFFHQKDKNRMSPNPVLKWIETCMLKHPSWIHVQNSSETLVVGLSTPPASPHYAPSACAMAFSELMSPTNGDHVLNCALVFSTTVFDGNVALLTNDTALKIKAMAEGIVCEAATVFCQSLLSPYSDRFLWAGSVAHHRPHGIEMSCHSGALEISNRTIAEPNKTASFMSVPRGMVSKKKHQAVENIKDHCKQAQGLKVILS